MSLLNNSGILRNKAFQQSVTVKRNQVGSFNDTTGVWEPGTAIDPVTVKVSVQPVKFKEMAYLVEAMEGGQRIRDAIRIYNVAKDFEFRPGVIGASTTEADIVVYRNLEWTVIQLPGNWIEHGHQKVYGVRVDGQDG